MNHLKITIIQAFLLLVITSAVTNQTILIPLILKASGRDSWLSVVFSIVPGILLLAMLQFIMNTTTKEPIIAWVKRHFGAIASWMIALPFLLYLFFVCLITLRDTTNWVDTTFLPESPRFVIAASLTLLCFFLAEAGLWPITVCAGVLLPFYIVLEFFLFFVNLQFKNYQYMTPVLENGFIPVLHGTIFSTHSVLEIVILLLIQQHINTKVRPSFILLLVVVQVGLVLGTLMDIITSFSPSEAIQQRYPTFEQWGLVSLGKHFSHLDFLSIYEWLSGSFIRMSLCMYTIAEILHFKGKLTRKIILISLTVILLMSPLLPVSDPLFVWFLRELFYPISLIWVFIILCLLLFFAVIVRIRERRGRSNAVKSNSTN